MTTDKIVARILVIALTLLAAIGLIGTLYLLANNIEGNSVAVFVGLAGVPIGAVSALATTRTGNPVEQIAANLPSEAPQKPVELLPSPEANPGIVIPNKSSTELLDEMAKPDPDYAIPPLGY